PLLRARSELRGLLRRLGFLPLLGDDQRAARVEALAGPEVVDLTDRLDRDVVTLRDAAERLPFADDVHDLRRVGVYWRQSEEERRQRDNAEARRGERKRHGSRPMVRETGPRRFDKRCRATRKAECWPAVSRGVTIVPMTLASWWKIPNPPGQD